MTPWLTLMDIDAWNFFGVGVGQSEIIYVGIVLATLLTIGYRVLTRGKRY